MENNEVRVLILCTTFNLAAAAFAAGVHSNLVKTQQIVFSSNFPQNMQLKRICMFNISKYAPSIFTAPRGIF